MSASNLEANINRLPASDHAFAHSLLAAYKAGRATSKQMAWIDKLTAKAGQAQVTQANLSPILALFSAAKGKFPRLTFTVDGIVIALKQAGAKSATPGAIMVTDGKPYGENTFFGRVMPTGEWKPSLNVAAVQSTLEKLSCDPVGFVGEYGKATSQCCFCGDQLTHADSLAVGYGPVCAKKWNLPHGK